MLKAFIVAWFEVEHVSSWKDQAGNLPSCFCSVFVSLLQSTKALLKARKLPGSVAPWSHWHLLTHSLLPLLSHLFSCQKSILQGPGRQRVKAFHHSSSRDQTEEHTVRTLAAIVSIYKYCAQTGKEGPQNGENQCFHFNWIDTQHAVLPRELQPRTIFFISFGFSWEFWCLML